MSPSIKLDPQVVENERTKVAAEDYAKDREKIQAEKESFEKSFDEALAKDDGKKDKKIQVKVDSLAQSLRATFDQRVQERNLIEQEMLKNLKQFKGIYSEEVLSNMHPNRSKAFIRFTRTKVKTVVSRLVDFLFPANGDKNWGITPTPIPETNPELLRLMQLQYEEQTGNPINREEMLYQVQKFTEQAAENMSVEIEDQLADLDYRTTLRSVIHDGCVYGTGVLKGPLVKLKNNKSYVQDPNTGQWVTLRSQSLIPFIEHVSTWDFYPDLTAKTIGNCRDIFQRHNMDKSKLTALANRSDFNRDAINQHLTTFHTGDMQLKDFETEMDTMGNINTISAAQSQSKKFEVLEYWGYVDAYMLERLGVKVPDNMKGIQELKANVWILGNRVIKAVLDPLESDRWPYYLFYYDKDETSIFGEGIPSIMSDIQELMNASFRAMLDNAAISAGPQIEANLDLLGPDEDPSEFYPFKVWLRTGTGVESQHPAIRVHQLPSYTNEFIAMSNVIERYGDEITTIPKFLHGGGTQGIGGAGRTMGGMSMMMGNANISIKDQVKNFDDGITRPFISAMYDWNMQFNDKPEIKGDFDVMARGTSSLIAKEVYTESLMNFAAITNNPVDQQFIMRRDMLAKIAIALDLDEKEFLKSKERMALEQQQASVAQKEEQQFAMHITETARAGGVSPEDLLNHINMLHEELKATQQMVANVQQQQQPV